MMSAMHQNVCLNAVRECVRESFTFCSIEISLSGGRGAVRGLKSYCTTVCVTSSVLYLDSDMIYLVSLS